MQMQIFRAKNNIIHEDGRGIISALLEGKTIKNIRDVLFITGKEGAIRGNHWHKKDTHYCIVLSGKIEYRWGTPEGEAAHQAAILEQGDMVFTPAGEVHRFRFVTEGSFVAMATEYRDQESYEKDTIRV